jgi:3-hydroxybutyryl-CoA dehydratase
MRFQELEVGASAMLRRTVTDADVVLFAGVTGDTNPVHLDQISAEESYFGGRIAHGMLSAGLISAVLGTRLPGPGTVYLQQSLRFLAPVRIGDTVTARVEITEVIHAKRRVRLATVCSNQHGENVLDGEALVWLPEDGREAATV